jgi:pimeloyl-ACP methyl ester carboxylesterase
MFLMDGGSVRARIALAGARLREFGVALFPKAASRRRGNLVEALRARGEGGDLLPRLEGLNQADLENKRGVIIFLHGLMSSDAGTFDQLVKRIKSDTALYNVHLVGWPHDTLARINVNAQDLAELIENRLGPSGLPILFVCHSRGGLVARAAVVKLLNGNPRWAKSLSGAVTFGTPHLGAELAERGDEFLGKLLLLKTIQQTGKSVPLVDALCAVGKEKTIEGISDLRPTSNGGKFLYQLREDEAKQAGGAGKRVLPMFVVGGRAEPGGTTGWLSRRFFGGEPNDLVVPLSSTAPAPMRPSNHTTTDHFSYFTSEEMKKGQIPALDYIIAAFKTQIPNDRNRELPSRPRAGATRVRRTSPSTGAEAAAVVQPSGARSRRLETTHSSRN